MPLNSEMHKTEAKGNKVLRNGYTTGSCAAAAAKAAIQMLLGKEEVLEVPLLTPKGTQLQLTIHEISRDEDRVRCAVCKDSGDDPDVTNGIMVFATITLTSDNQVTVDGGIGVGRVTLPGLSQKVGEAAINRIPKQMIIHEVNSVCEQFGYLYLGLLNKMNSKYTFLCKGIAVILGDTSSDRR